MERIAELSDNLLVEAHGSFATASCIECGLEYPMDKLRDDIANSMNSFHFFSLNIDRIPHCTCGELVKPDIVFYGEPLPIKYTWMHTADMVTCDMLIIMWTSLSVQPFSSLIHKIRENVPRVLFNNEPVGPFRFCEMACCFRDVYIPGDCDTQVKALCKELGWEEELETLYQEGKSAYIFGQESFIPPFVCTTPSNPDELHKRN